MLARKGRRLFMKKGFVSLCLAAALCFTQANTALAVFEYGDEGQVVVDMQKRLAELNYTVGYVDGIFGEDTEEAIKAFQRDQNLDVDGIVGGATYRALMDKELPPNRSGHSALIRKIVRVAYSMMGVPYVFGGTTPYGFDCSGFTQYVFARAGVYIPRTADIQMDYGRYIAPDDLRIGDLVFFTTYEPGASHCGIYLGGGKFIHAGASTGITVADVFGSYWGARYYGACRIF